jgi:hypothetical protein
MSAIAAITSAKLLKELMATMKEWAMAGGMETDLRTRKAVIVKWLVEHPEAIPEERRATFAEKEADGGNKEPDASDKEPGPTPVTSSDFAELRTILLGVKGQLDDVSLGGGSCYSARGRTGPRVTFVMRSRLFLLAAA